MTTIESNFSKLLIFGGIFNITLALPLAFPGSVTPYFQFMWFINQWLGLGGIEPTVALAPINAFFVNTAGIDLVLVGVIVIYSGLAPLKRKLIPIANAAGRTLFTILVAYYTMIFDLIQIIAIIGAIDLLISAGFVYYLLRLKGEQS